MILCHGVHRNEWRKANIGAVRVHHRFKVGTESFWSSRNAVEIALNLEQWNEFDVHKQQQEQIALLGARQPDIHRIRDRPTSQLLGTVFWDSQRNFHATLQRHVR